MTQSSTLPATEPIALSSAFADGATPSLDDGIIVLSVAAKFTSRPLLIVAASGYLLRVNEAAEALLVEDGPILVRGDKLLGRTAEITKALTGVVSASLATDRIQHESLTHQQKTLVVSARSLLGHFGSLTGSYALLELRQPSARLASDPQLVSKILGITLAEARVVSKLCSSVGKLPDIAADLNVRPTTVRTLLSRVFEKTGVSTQAELCLLMATTFSA